jgi:hypothetical protein
MNRDGLPNTPESNLGDPEYTPEREGPMDIPLSPTPEVTTSVIEKLPQELSVDQLAERSRRGGL